MNTPCAPPLSVIIPVLHEAAGIHALVDHVRSLPYSGPVEIIVADAAGDTLAALERESVVRVAAPRSRALQMNAGAAHATGDILLFLHADTRLPPNALQLAAHTMAQTRPDSSPRYAAGAFSLRVDSENPLLRALIRIADLRNRLTRTPYGDQAIFVRTALFRQLGGFAAIPIMEDVAFMRRLRRLHRKDRLDMTIRVLDEPVMTSARRWEKEGVLRASLRNIALRALFACGVPAAYLTRHYRPHADAPAAPATADGTIARGATARRSSDCVLFFVKPPVPGAVKTRLAAALGATAATALYDAFARDMYDTLRGLGATVRVCVAPEHGGGPEQAAVWLDPAAECCAQWGRDVGERMGHAFASAFADGFDRVLCIGSDIPDLPAATPRIGLEALAAGAGGAVLAPAQDGGYYCIGFTRRRFAPQTFASMAWSTGQVYAQTRARLERAGCDTVLLPPWRDVDTIDDLHALALRLQDDSGAANAPRTAALLRTLGPF